MEEHLQSKGNLWGVGWVRLTGEVPRTERLGEIGWTVALGLS
jgi:hypothetical protein